MAVVDIDISIEKVQSMRSEFRALHLSLERLITAEEYEKSYKVKYDSIINCIKEYIIDATEAKRQKRDIEDYDVKSDKISSETKRVEDFKKNCETTNFLLLEVERMMDESDVVFSKCIDSELPDEVVSQLMENLPKERSRVDTWSRKYEKLLEIMPQTYEDRGKILNLLRLSYNNLMKSKKKYERNLLQEYEVRELSKQKAFKPSMLDINLEKYSGYQSSLDIYSFQDEFEKRFKQQFPKKRLCDLLKNNYLEDPASSLVKSLDDIDSVWKRLQEAFGDPRVLLKHKIESVKNIGSLHRVKDQEKLKDAIAKLINLMNELIKLSQKHNIELKLYNGPALDLIYNLLGEYRLTRWLNEISGKGLEDKPLWDELISFLGKELKVQEEKISNRYESKFSI